MKEVLKKYIEVLIGTDIMLWSDKLSSSERFTIKNGELIIKPELVEYLNNFFGQEIDKKLIGDSIIEIIKDIILRASTIPVDFEDILSTDEYKPFDKYSHLEYSILQDRPDITNYGKPNNLDKTERLKEFQKTIESIPNLNNLTYIIPEPNDWSRILA